MSEKLEILKKKILYRSLYRGTKEMDILLSSFVKEHINSFNERQLKELEKFLEYEDEIISNYYNLNFVEKNIDKNEVSKFLKFLKFNGGEGGIRTHERVASLLVFKTSAFSTAQPPLQRINSVFITIKEDK